MNKVIIFLSIIFFMTLTTEIIAGIYIVETELKWRYYYEYVTLDGQTGRSSNCYQYENDNWCRNTTKTFKVASYIQKKERR